MIEILVIGTPAPQGSKTRTRWGVRDDNPNTKPWRADVKAEAVAARAGRPTLDGPLRLEVTFTFLRPAAHFGTGRNAGILKRSAPTYQTVAPDADKLVRAIGDALTQAGVVRDDSRFAVVVARKVYGETASARILVSAIDEAAARVAA